MALTPGSRLGPYEVISAIGAGGMGEVYRARDAKLNRDVAIKILPDLFTLDPERRARFEREAQTLAALNHPNIAAIYAVIEAPAALVMELVEGEDLSAHIARGSMPIADVLPIARQIAEALEAAHELGIVHRDLKPANIKVRADGTVKVLDFGLAKASGPDTSMSTADAMQSPTFTSPARMTQMGVILGTAAYMAPEQAKGKAVDQRADIWAFGVVLYEMLTGTRLFDAEDVSETLAAVLTRDVSLAPLPAGTPPRLRALVRDCLVRDPKKRLRDIGDARLMLDHGDVPADAAPPAPRRPVWPWALAALAAGAVATWVAIAFSGPTATPSPVALVEPPAPGTAFLEAPMPSPDGLRLAWIALDAAGKTRLWARDLADLSPRALDGSDGVVLAFWSRDSRHLAFVAQGQLWRITPGGGPASLIVSATPRSGVWLEDGTILLALTGQGLMRVPATGGSLRPANGFTSDTFRNLYIHGLDVSPDGRWLLFTQFGGETGVYAARLDGTAKRLLYPGEQSRAIFVGPDVIVRKDGKLLIAQRFDSSDMQLVGDTFPIAQNVGDRNYRGAASGALSFIAGPRAKSRLTWLNRDGRPVGVVGPEAEYSEVAISRGGRWLGFVRADPGDDNEDVWLQALPDGAPNRVTSDPDTDHLFTISHDEREIAWEAHAKGVLNLMRRPVDGSSPAKLVRAWGKSGGPVDWSPDGRVLLYESMEGTAGPNLWAVPMDRAGDPVRLTQPGVGGSDGHYSSDGRWLAFVGEATGQKEIYVQRLEDMKLVGGPVRVSEGGGQWPLWRRDGAELLFFNRGAVMAADFNPQSDRPVRVPRALFTIAGSGKGPSGSNRSYAVTPDGQRFIAIVSTPDATPHSATVVLNWRAAR